MTRGTKLVLGAVIGFVVSVAGPAAAVALPDSWAWLAWSPALVLLAVFGLAFDDEGRNPWGKGLLLGLAVALVVGAGVCFATYEYVP
jgi:hypothetical protein